MFANVLDAAFLDHLYYFLGIGHVFEFGHVYHFCCEKYKAQLGQQGTAPTVRQHLNQRNSFLIVNSTVRNVQAYT